MRPLQPTNPNLQTTHEDRVAAMQLWKESGLTKKEFCKKNNIRENTFYRWQKELNKIAKRNEAVRVETKTKFQTENERLVLRAKELLKREEQDDKVLKLRDELKKQKEAEELNNYKFHVSTAVFYLISTASRCRIFL